MAHPKFRIAAFPSDDQLWRVDWFGGIVYNSANLSEPQIMILISPFNSLYKMNPASKYAVSPEKQRQILVGVGQLPIIHIGSIWQNGEPQPIYEYSYKEKSFNLDIRQETMQIISTGHNIIPKNYHAIGNRIAFNTKCLCIKHQDDPYSIIIPMIELIRFYYVQSSKFSKALFNGSYWGDQDLIINTKESFINENGYCGVVVRTDYTDHDVWLGARLAFSKVAKMNANKIYTSILKYLKNNGGGIAIPETYPPFEGTTRLICYGKFIKSSTFKSDNNKWRFLVYWIKSCSAPMPYKDIGIISRDNNGLTPLLTDNDREEVLWPNRKRIINNGQNEYEISISDDQSATQIEETFIETLPIARFTYLIGKKLDKIRKIRSEYKAGKKITEAIEINTIECTTGDKTYSDSDKTQLNITLDDTSSDENKIEKYDNRSFDNFLKALKALSTKGDISYKIIPASKKTIYSYYGPLSLFPSYDRGKSMSFSSFKTNGNKRINRKAIAASVKYGSYLFYFIEIQEQPDKDENFMVLFCHNHSFSELSLQELERILLYCARNKGKWFQSGEIPGLFREAFKHSWSSPEAFAKKAIKKMNGALYNY